VVRYVEHRVELVLLDGHVLMGAIVNVNLSVQAKNVVQMDVVENVEFVQKTKNV